MSRDLGCIVMAAVARCGVGAYSVVCRLTFPCLARDDMKLLFSTKPVYFTQIWVHSCPLSYLDTYQDTYRCPCMSVTSDRFVLTTTHYNSPQLTSVHSHRKSTTINHSSGDHRVKKEKQILASKGCFRGRNVVSNGPTQRKAFISMTI